MSKGFYYTEKVNYVNNLILPSKNDLYRCGKTALLATKATSKYKVGCTIYSGKTIIGCGVSSTKTHPFQKKINANPERCYLHAEIAALINADVINYTNKKLYVIRVWKNGLMADSWPCNFCLNAIIEADIKQVFYYDYGNVQGIYL